MSSYRRSLQNATQMLLRLQVLIVSSGYTSTVIHWCTGFHHVFRCLHGCVLCLTLDIITTMTIADPSFPVGYSYSQFNLLLDNNVLEDNLAAITEKVVDTSFQEVILNKLTEVSNKDPSKKCTKYISVWLVPNHLLIVFVTVQ